VRLYVLQEGGDDDWPGLKVNLEDKSLVQHEQELLVAKQEEGRAADVLVAKTFWLG